MAANIIGADIGQSDSAIPNSVTPQSSSQVGTAQNTVDSISSCVNLSDGIPTEHYPSNDSNLRNAAGPISPCLKIDASIPRAQHSVQTEPTFSGPDVEDSIMTGIPLVVSVPREITSDIVKPQMVLQGEVENNFAASNVQISEQMSSPHTEDWQTLLSLAGVPGISNEAMNTYPVFESDASLLLASATMPYSGDVEMGDFGWLDDVTIDLDTILDPQLAMANHLAMMAEIAAGGALIESSRSGGEGTEFTAYNAVQETPPGFGHSDMDLIRYETPDDTSEALVGGCEDAFQAGSLTTDFGYSDTILAGYGNTGLSHQVVGSSEANHWNLEDCPSALSVYPPPSSPSLQPVKDFSLPRPEGRNAREYLDPVLSSSPTTALRSVEFLAPGTFPSLDPSSHPACTLPVPEHEQMSFSDQALMAGWLSMPVEPDEMNFDGDINTVVLLCANDISISSELSVPTTLPPMSPILQLVKPDTSHMTQKVDEDMIDWLLEPYMLNLPLELLDAAQSTIGTLSSSISGDDPNESIERPPSQYISRLTSSPDSAGNEAEQVAGEVSESFTSDTPAENENLLQLLDAAQAAIKPLTASSSGDCNEYIEILCSSSPTIPSLAASNEVEQVAGDVPGIIISNDKPVERDITTPENVEPLVPDEGIHLESTELHPEATVRLPIHSTPGVKNHYSRKLVERPKWTKHKKSILIRKLTSQIRDLTTERMDNEQAGLERTRLHCAQVAELEERKREEARCIKELLRRQEVEIGELAKELMNMRAEEAELRKESERKDVEYARKKVEWEKTIREDERKMVQLGKVQDLKGTSEVYKALDSGHVSWNSWATKVPRKEKESAPVISVPVKKAVTAAIRPEITPPSLTIAGGRKTKTPVLSTTYLEIPMVCPMLKQPLVDIRDRPYSITLGFLLIIAVGVQLIVTGNYITNTIALGSCIWLSLRWDSHSSCRTYCADITGKLVLLAKGFLFGCTVAGLTGFSWLKAISMSLKRRAPIDADVSQDDDDVMLWEDLMDVGGLGVDKKISEARFVPVVDAVTREVCAPVADIFRDLLG